MKTKLRGLWLATIVLAGTVSGCVAGPDKTEWRDSGETRPWTHTKVLGRTVRVLPPEGGSVAVVEVVDRKQVTHERYRKQVQYGPPGGYSLLVDMAELVACPIALPFSLGADVVLMGRTPCGAHHDEPHWFAGVETMAVAMLPGINGHSFAEAWNRSQTKNKTGIGPTGRSRWRKMVQAKRVRVEEVGVANAVVEIRSPGGTVLERQRTNADGRVFVNVGAMVRSLKSVPGARIDLLVVACDDVKVAWKVPMERVSGELLVDVIPWGLVEVDGKPYGHAPLAVEGLSAGQHEVYVVSGVRAWRGTVTVRPAARTPLVVDLLGAR